MIKNIIISVFVVIFAALSIYSHCSVQTITSEDYLVFINSGIGLLGVILFVTRLGAHGYFFFFWSILQLVVLKLADPLSFEVFKNAEEVMVLNEVNFIQSFAYHPPATSFELGFGTATINVVPLAFIVALMIPSGQQPKRGVKRAPTMKYQSGEIFELKLFRDNTMLSHLLPQRVKVVKLVSLSESHNWMLVSLSKPLKFKNGRVIYNALIKPKDDDKFKRNEPGQLGYFRLLKDRKALTRSSLDIRHTTFVDWVFVK